MVIFEKKVFFSGMPEKKFASLAIFCTPHKYQMAATLAVSHIFYCENLKH